MGWDGGGNSKTSRVDELMKRPGGWMTKSMVPIYWSGFDTGEGKQWRGLLVRRRGLRLVIESIINRTMEKWAAGLEILHNEGCW